MQPNISSSYDPDQFIVKFESGQTFLGNVYQEYNRAPRKFKKEVLQRFAATAISMGEEPQAFADVAGNILPVVRPRSVRESLRIKALTGTIMGGDAETLRSPSTIAGIFNVDLAIDSEEAIRSLSLSKLQEWDVSLESAMQIASANLRNMSGGKWQEPLPGLYVSSWSDCYDVSRITTKDIIEKLQVKGNPVALCATRSQILVTGSQDPQGLLAAMILGKSAQENDRPISLIPIVLEDDAWRVFYPEKELEVVFSDAGEQEHPLACYRNERIIERSVEYGEQKELLEEYFEQEGIDLFVATHSVYGAETEDGWDVSAETATWTKGVFTLLPEVETYMLLDPENQKVWMIPFELAMTHFGERLGATEYYPKRYEVRSFPTDSELAATGVTPDVMT